LSLKTKNFLLPKRATLDKRIFLDFKGSPLLCQPNPENRAKSAVALHVSNNLCLKVKWNSMDFYIQILMLSGFFYKKFLGKRCHSHQWQSIFRIQKRFSRPNINSISPGRIFVSEYQIRTTPLINNLFNSQNHSLKSLLCENKWNLGQLYFKNNFKKHRKTMNLWI